MAISDDVIGFFSPGGKTGLLTSSVNTVRFPCGNSPVFWISIMTW